VIGAGMKNIINGREKMKKDKKKIIEEKAEKSTEIWFNQWCKDENADIVEYFKSIWIDGYEEGRQNG
jgi:hypothetical protein